MFTTLFSVALIAKVAIVAAPTLSAFPAPPPAGAHRPVILALGAALLALLCLALFRLSGLLADRPQKADPEPLFQSPSAAYWEAYAKAKAAAEQPLTPAMNSVVLSFGPGRQLSMKDCHRLTSVLLVGTFIVQLLLAGTVGGGLAVVAPAILLGVCVAIATFFSAEMIARAQRSLKAAWKVQVALIILTVALFALGSSPKLWFVRTVLTDLTLFAFGSLAVSTMHALSRNSPRD